MADTDDVEISSEDQMLNTPMPSANVVAPLPTAKQSSIGSEERILLVALVLIFLVGLVAFVIAAP